MNYCENCKKDTNNIPFTVMDVEARMMVDRTGDVQHIPTSMQCMSCKECGWVKSSFLNIVDK